MGGQHTVLTRRKPVFQDSFLENAASIYAAAEAAAARGQGVTEMTILVRRDGSVHMVAESDWPLESLRLHHGADAAYRVAQHQQRVSVDCRTGFRACRITSGEPAGAARRLLGQAALYRLAAGA